VYAENENKLNKSEIKLNNCENKQNKKYAEYENKHNDM
jgi:hypothetical protein